MAIGKMRQRITVLKPVETRDDFGGVQVSWQTLVTCWAEVLFGNPGAGMTSREREQSGKIISSDRPMFRIRHRDDITEKMRIRWQSQDYEIRQVLRADLKDGRYNRQYMTLICEKTVE